MVTVWRVTAGGHFQYAKLADKRTGQKMLKHRRHIIDLAMMARETAFVTATKTTIAPTMSGAMDSNSDDLDHIATAALKS